MKTHRNSTQLQLLHQKKYQTYNKNIVNFSRKSKKLKPVFHLPHHLLKVSYRRPSVHHLSSYPASLFPFLYISFVFSFTSSYQQHQMTRTFEKVNFERRDRIRLYLHVDFQPAGRVEITSKFGIENARRYSV